MSAGFDFALAAPSPDDDLAPLRARIAAACRGDEARVVRALIPEARLTPEHLAAAQSLGSTLAQAVRVERSNAGGVDALMLEFSLDSREGIALMCLAEALLRIPDAATRDRLIRDKISKGDWSTHVGASPSLFVNAAAWGLLVTGKIVDSRSEGTLETALASLVRKGGEPLIRKGVDLAMRLLGRQFVTGRTIDEALANARERETRGYTFSFDMLGEAAMTAADAARYLASYENAIHAIGRAAAGRGVVAGPGISVKLSALHPRYSRAKRERVRDELVPRVLALAELARKYDIGFSMDAEEADRLDLSLDILETLAAAPSLADWSGLGFVVQAYQKRARHVVDWLVALARRHRRCLMVRLTKGAYWDSEIKRAQVDGLAGYPVFTRKVHTDVSYLACAKAMLAAPEAIYPQFASHNAFTVAAVHALAGTQAYEFQCLHGMGESIYDQVVGKDKLDRACRIYAPVGSHETLLAYLVRRLLENGANSSFVNRIVDPAVSIESLVVDPVALAEKGNGAPHASIPLPAALLPGRRNSAGADLADDAALAELASGLAAASVPRTAVPVVAFPLDHASAASSAIQNPANRDEVVGAVVEATANDVVRAVGVAADAGRAWSDASPAARAACLERAADLLEAERATFFALAMREAGKTLANAVAEVREATDFLRYYAAQARAELAAPGVTAIGPVVAISPWNFPLAIFVGEVAAALAAGNPVLAKPAEQTPLIAWEAVRLLHRAGVPAAALQLLPGRGETVGAALVADPRVAGVIFTGSTDVARGIARELARRDDDPVLIAETGGQNAMIVDSSALAEQVVADALTSAFDSAGQRCSALRVLCVQEDVAPEMLAMLEGAMRELAIGDPRRLAVDVGPVIDADARAALVTHVQRMRAAGLRVVELPLPAECAQRNVRRTHARRSRRHRRARASFPRGVRPRAARRALEARRARGSGRCDQRDRLRPHARHSYAHRRDGRGDPRAGRGRQRLRQPQRRRGGRRRAALRRTPPVRHGTEGRRPALPATARAERGRRDAYGTDRAAGTDRRDQHAGIPTARRRAVHRARRAHAGRAGESRALARQHGGHAPRADRARGARPSGTRRRGADRRDRSGRDRRGSARCRSRSRVPRADGARGLGRSDRARRGLESRRVRRVAARRRAHGDRQHGGRRR